MTPHQPGPVTTEQMREMAKVHEARGNADTADMLDSAADQLDALQKERDDLIRKGEGLCHQNGMLLIEAHDLKKAAAERDALAKKLAKAEKELQALKEANAIEAQTAEMAVAAADKASELTDIAIATAEKAEARAVAAERVRDAAQLVVDVWQGNGGRKDAAYYKGPILTLSEGRDALEKLATVLLTTPPAEVAKPAVEAYFVDHMDEWAKANGLPPHKPAAQTGDRP